MDRRDIGSWLQGPPRPSGYPGQALGAPEYGPGSVARLGRRFAALIIDWGMCYLIAAAFFAADSWAILGLFAIEQILLLSTAGFSFGHRLLGLRLQRLDGGPPGFRRALVRTALLVIVIPALINDRDGRGLHDRAVGTALVRL